MRDIIDPLGMIAEFSIGLAGFTGIVAALFAQRVTPLVHFRFVNLLLTSFAPGFFALFTIAVLYAGMREEAAVRVFSAGLIAHLVIWGVYVRRKSVVLGVGDGGLNRRLSLVFQSVALLNVALQAVNVLVAPPFATGVYLVGLVLLLLIGAFQFATLALGMFVEQMKSGPPAPPPLHAESGGARESDAS